MRAPKPTGRTKKSTASTRGSESIGRARTKRTTTSIDPLARVRSICLALPEATEKIAWGAPTFRVNDKLFAIFADNHHNDGRVALWCNAPKGAQEVLAGSEPQRYFRPPYVGPRGWIGVLLETNSDDDVARIVREAYCMVAPKRLVARVDV
jgi:hypothetical protein